MYDIEATKQRDKRTAEDFLIHGMQSGVIEEEELAYWLVRGYDYDIDRVSRLIKAIVSEQVEYIEEWYEYGEDQEKLEALQKLNEASQVDYERYEN